MSRISLIPISIPASVTCTIKDQHVTVTGPKGSMTLEVHNHFMVEQNGQNLSVKRKHENLEEVESVPSRVWKKSSAMHGTMCRLLRNNIIGVSEGFSINLELVGVGYRAELVQGGKALKIALGYSHDIIHTLPEDISIDMEKPTIFKVTGVDKQKVGQVASDIIRYRRPEPYKGKGVRKKGQYLRMKETKSKK